MFIIGLPVFSVLYDISTFKEKKTHEFDNLELTAPSQLKMIGVHWNFLKFKEISRNVSQKNVSPIQMTDCAFLLKAVLKV